MQIVLESLVCYLENESDLNAHLQALYVKLFICDN